MPNNIGGGFGTRHYVIPSSGMNVQQAQILKGSGYVSINIRGAHYSSQGNLWQKMFGGSDKVTLSTQVDYFAAGASTSTSSIEDVRQIATGHPYYFDGGRPVALKLPLDCDSVGMTISMSAVKNDNLTGALNILNSGELQGVLSLAPVDLKGALTTAGVVKKLLTNTDPQSTLTAKFAGKVSVAAALDPLTDDCLMRGTCIYIYYDSASDTSLDTLDSTKLTIDGDGLKYNGVALHNTYVMFQVSFDLTRGEDTQPWVSTFSDSESALDNLGSATTDAARQAIWQSAYAIFVQAAKLLKVDPSFTVSEKTGIAAKHLKSLRDLYAADGGGSAVPAVHTEAHVEIASLISGDIDAVAAQYDEQLAVSNLATAGGENRSVDV